MKTLYQHKAEYIREVYKKTGSVKEAAKVLDCSEKTVIKYAINIGPWDGI